MTTEAGQDNPATDAHSGDEQPDGPHDDGDPDDNTDGDGQHDGDQDDGQGGNREAAKWRTRFREAERLLNQTRQAIVDRTVNAAGLDPRLMIAAGHTTESFVDENGLIDHDALADAITTTAQEFNIRRGRLEPNPQQGTGGGQQRSGSSWSQALKGR